MEKNIVKEVCKELKVTQKELGEIIQVSLPTIARWAGDEKKIPKTVVYTLNLLLENIALKKKLTALREIQKTLKNL